MTPRWHPLAPQALRTYHRTPSSGAACLPHRVQNRDSSTPLPCLFVSLPGWLGYCAPERAPGGSICRAQREIRQETKETRKKVI